ncbi:MAG: phosphoribosylamine--glycine ligase, partial [Gemmatimonadaceae bacterium]|nr:phosphoribosylamine--glycine ligase [Acetobacteraceae bacterium]
ADGGRVLTVCGTGADLAAARAVAYAAVAQVPWRDGAFRSDIGLDRG